jgi:hypothetical protein
MMLTVSTFQPVVAVQNNLPPAQNSIGMALLLFSQLFGGAFFLAIAETIFSDGLISGLSKYAPTVDAQAVVAAGAAAIRQIVSPDELEGVLYAYNAAISHDFYMCAGAAAGMLLFAWAMGWRKINTNNKILAPTKENV